MWLTPSAAAAASPATRGRRTAGAASSTAQAETSGSATAAPRAETRFVRPAESSGSHGVAATNPRASASHSKWLARDDWPITRSSPVTTIRCSSASSPQSTVGARVAP